jgi:hypothetical protein
MRGRPCSKMATIATTILLTAGLLAGCSNDETSLTTTTGSGLDDFEQLDLDQTYGGLTATDEDVAFGDEALKAMMLAEDQEVVIDPLADDPVVLEMEERARHRERYEEGERPQFTYLRLRWGMLRGPDDSTSVERPCDVTDWTGTIRTDRGLVVVKRKIKFEYPADHVVFPRLDPQTVAFVSHTWCHFDGLVIEIVEPPIDTSTTPVSPNKLYVDTPLFQGEFLVSDLAGINQIFEVDDMGNRIQINGFGLSDIEVCPKGFLSGRYRHGPQVDPGVEATEGVAVRYGSFAGAWYSLNGGILGFMRGGYGVDANGERIFIGKIIDRRGHFSGFLRGGWEPGSDDRGLGEFRGSWMSRSGSMEGYLGGESHPVEGYPGGFYEGRWTSLCDNEAEGLVQ